MLTTAYNRHNLALNSALICSHDAVVIYSICAIDFSKLHQANFKYPKGLESFSDWEEDVSLKKNDLIPLSPDRVNNSLQS
jgi:hypothetical protein